MIAVSQTLLVLCLLGMDGSWTLDTADTRVTIGVQDNMPVIRELEAIPGVFSWTGGGCPVPLMEQAAVDGRLLGLNWVFTNGQLADDAILRLQFTNERPSLALTSCWRARPGRGTGGTLDRNYEHG